jgi:hypothetical protein
MFHLQLIGGEGKVCFDAISHPIRWEKRSLFNQRISDAFEYFGIDGEQ